MGEKSSISKDQLREFNDMKSEINKNKEMYDTLLTSQKGNLEDVQRKLDKQLEENKKLANTNSSLQSQVDHYAKMQSNYERELPKLKSDNKAYT